jgi:hypothetical protein
MTTNCDPRTRNVLLELHVLVYGEETLELLRQHQLEKFAVAF